MCWFFIYFAFIKFSFTKNEYFDIIEKLKLEDEAFKENTNYQDIIVYLYRQKQNILKSIDEIPSRMLQIRVNNESRDPDDSFKTDKVKT